jgi:hypothetical protein
MVLESSDDIFYTLVREYIKTCYHLNLYLNVQCIV